MQEPAIPACPLPLQRCLSSVAVWTCSIASLASCGGSAAAAAGSESPANPPPDSSSPTSSHATTPATSAPSRPAPSASAGATATQPTPQPASKPASQTQPAQTTPAPPPRCPEGMALVGGGEFQRAGTAAPKAIADLCVDVTETTTTQYAECVNAGACTTDGLDCSAQSTYGHEGKENFPVVCIVYEQAKAYCAHRGKRLPSVDEWEWFARSGDEARAYSWGNEPPDEQLCWTGKHKQSESCPVGSHPEDKSRDGILDLAGNVLEFTTTEADAASPIRIARGGAWNGGDAGLFKNARLGGFRIDYRCGFLGVRCVTEASEVTGSPPDETTAAK